MKKILIIDDAEFILDSSSLMLELEGYNVITAKDGHKGVEAAIANKPDLILCDISMPKLDGYGCLELIRANPQINSTPFIFLTAFNEKSNMRAAMEKGADDFIIKPFTRDELLAAIEAQWKKRESIQQRLQEKVDEVSRNVTYALPHEFRTALNQIAGSAKFIRQNPDKISQEELVELTDDILESSGRLMKITESYLTYIKLEVIASSEEMTNMLQMFAFEEPAPVIYDIAMQKALQYKRIEDVVMDGDVENISINMSGENFQKMLNELLDNSFKFSNNGAKVTVKVEIKDEALHIEISDQGRGMDEEQIKSIGALKQFERTVYEQQGVGLGLIISKRIIELHKGSFNIISKEGEGCKYQITLPFNRLN